MVNDWEPILPWMDLENRMRQTGTTTALAQRCLEIGGTFVCLTETSAGCFRKKFPGLKAVSLRDSIPSNGPIILDYAVLTTCFRYIFKDLKIAQIELADAEYELTMEHDESREPMRDESRD